MLTFGKTHSEVIGHHIEDVIQNFCLESDLVKMPERSRNMTLSPVNNDDNGSGKGKQHTLKKKFLKIVVRTGVLRARTSANAKRFKTVLALAIGFITLCSKV